MLLDSNIIIYAFDPQYPQVWDFMERGLFHASEISKLEVMGYHKLIDQDYQDFVEFFEGLPVFGITKTLIDDAVQLRRKRSMGLADAIIAATALEFEMPLVTHNVVDFKWIPGLEIIDPLKNKA